MTALSALWLPIVLSAVIVFVVSSIIHMVLPWHKNDFPKMPKEDEFRRAVGPLAIPPGDYMVPRAASMQDMRSPAFMEKLKQGPVVVLTVMPNEYTSMGKSLVQWFIYSLVVSLFAAYIAGRALPPGTIYLQVFRFIGATAFGDALNVSKAYTEALYGFSPSGGPAPRGQVSCLRLATQQTYGALSGEHDPDPVPQIAQRAVGFTQSDPLIRAADGVWSRCMAGHFYHYATPAQVEGRQWPSPPTRAETRTAAADVACKAQANLPNTWLTVEAAYQQALIAQNLPALSQLQANFGPLLERAEAALASPATTGITPSGSG